MSDYQADYAAILAKASELYRMLDALAEKRNAAHRERDAIALANAKLQIQKLLGVPPIIAAQPLPELTIDQVPDGVAEVAQTMAYEIDAAIMNDKPIKPASRRGRK